MRRREGRVWQGCEEVVGMLDGKGKGRRSVPANKKFTTCTPRTFVVKYCEEDNVADCCQKLS